MSPATPSYYALAALRGVGRQAVESILSARGEQPFADLADFARRINPRAVNKRVLESLVAAGAFDAIEKNRARAFAAVDTMLATAQRAHEDAAIGQSELFGGAAAPAPIALPTIEPWLPAERLQREYEAVGFFLSGHPLDDYAAALKRLRVQSWSEFARAVKAGAGAGRVAGTVVARTERRTKNGTKMGIIGLSDPSGHYEAVLFAEGLAQYRDLLEPGTAVLLFLTAEVQGDEVRARIQSVEPLDQAAAKMQKGLRVFLRDDAPIEGVAKRLEPIRLPAGAATAPITATAKSRMVLMLENGNEVEVKLPGPLQGVAADRRRHQGGDRRGDRRGALINVSSIVISSASITPRDLKFICLSLSEARRGKEPPLRFHHPIHAPVGARDMLRIENLIFDAWGRRFFDSASVAIPAGTKVGLVGRNGVGKSTLFKLIVGDLVPLGGEILLPKAARIGSVDQEHPGDTDEPARHDSGRRYATRSAQRRVGDRRTGRARGYLPAAERDRCGSRAGACRRNSQRPRLFQCRS